MASQIRIHNSVGKSHTPINTTLVAKQQKKQPINAPKLDCPDPRFNFNISKIPISSPHRASQPSPKINPKSGDNNSSDREERETESKNSETAIQTFAPSPPKPPQEADESKKQLQQQPELRVKSKPQQPRADILAKIKTLSRYNFDLSKIPISAPHRASQPSPKINPKLVDNNSSDREERETESKNSETAIQTFAPSPPEPPQEADATKKQLQQPELSAKSKPQQPRADILAKIKTLSRYNFDLTKIPISSPNRPPNLPPVQSKPNFDLSATNRLQQRINEKREEPTAEDIQTKEIASPSTPLDAPDGNNPESGINPTPQLGHSLANIAISNPLVQPKLTISNPGDEYEREADTVAAKVVERINTPNVAAQTPRNGRSQQEDPDQSPSELEKVQPNLVVDTIQRKCAECEKEEQERQKEEEEKSSSMELIQPKLTTGELGDKYNQEGNLGKSESLTTLQENSEFQPGVFRQTVDASVPNVQADFETTLNSAKGGGSPLDNTFRAKVEPAMGADFSDLNLHFVQRKSRYAIEPPNCEALDKANEVVREQLKADRDKNPNRKLTMEPQDANYRILWMDTYIKHGGKASLKNPHLKKGALSNYCKKQQEKPSHTLKPSYKYGYIVVTVVYKDRNGNTFKLDGANVHITDLLVHQVTDQYGKTRIEVPAGKPYVIDAWKKNYTEEMKQSSSVPIGGETFCQIELQSQKPGTLPVKVINENNQTVTGAKVFAEPVYKTHGSYKTLKCKTDVVGDCYFENIRWNTYKLRAHKDKAISQEKIGIVNRPYLNELVTLKINSEAKTMSICVSSARWYKISKPGKSPGVGILGLDVYFEIRDYDRNKVVTYFASMTTWGITWGAWWSSGNTTAPGERRDFDVPRTYDCNEESFSGAANLNVYTIGTNMYFDLIKNISLLKKPISVYQIPVGENTDKVPGVDRYSGFVKLLKQ